jgi:hypothetical protein
MPVLVDRRGHDAALARSADGHRLAAEVRVVPLLNWRVERIHVDVDDVALALRLATQHRSVPVAHDCLLTMLMILLNSAKLLRMF